MSVATQFEVDRARDRLRAKHRSDRRRKLAALGLRDAQAEKLALLLPIRSFGRAYDSLAAAPGSERPALAQALLTSLRPTPGKPLARPATPTRYRVGKPPLAKTRLSAATIAEISQILAKL